MFINVGGQLTTPGNRQYSLQNVQESKTCESPEPTKVKRVTKLSFDDYFSQWNGIATTKPAANSSNTCKTSVAMSQMGTDV